VSGTIRRPKANVGAFSFTQVTIAYRVIESNDKYEYLYGHTHYVGVHNGGSFSLLLRGCGVVVLSYGKCDGGEVEAWPAYERIRCGETPAGLLVAGEPAQWDSVCDTRAVVEGHLYAKESEGWTVTALGPQGRYFAAVKAGGEFLLRLPSGSYQMSARNGHKQCSLAGKVKLRLAQAIHLTMRC
jgi:hypothetical protein